MLPPFASQMAHTLRDPRTLALLGVGAVAVASFAWYNMTRVEPAPEEIERARRDYLAATGRIVDGSITETHWIPDAPEPTPATLVYRYRIAGVTYECAQDVTPLPAHVRHVRIDLPVQVRFDPRNPGDSIVVAESWSGLRVNPAYEHDALPSTGIS